MAMMSLAAAPADDPLLRPISPEYAQRWLAPETPVRVFGNTFSVGFGGLSVAVIRTDAGLILVDGGVPQGVPVVEANLRKLGFSIRDVKLILSTEPHWDHAAGIAALARDSGATVLASARASVVLKNGGHDPADPQAAVLEPFPAVTKVRAVRDGERIRLGNVTVTAVASPGHTSGSMSWQWQSCEGKACATVLFASSLNPAAADGWRFADHPERVAMFRGTFARFRKLPCDILLTPHPDQSGGDRKLAAVRAGARPNPFRDPASCKAYADRFEALLDKRLRDEAAR
ncbi:metallo-beta-lactamase class B [Novosphingobium chloroacetimidivorans]|uniref:Metallo-beta-lactamase class B n=1 Tax=Novosphingobium chloroacetimidivorans TaxID=1428314 RepID=A0A7W7K879_9SPHN|nr:metallo-beta-lactamase class B [Novosphingobium chloroacetimidivorans]